MTDAINQIIVSLNEVFAPMDAEVLAATKVWIEERAAAVAAFWTSDFYKGIKRNPDAVYHYLFAAAGGKTWYKVIGTGPAGRAAFVEKNCAAIAEKRNATIAAKLVKAGVTEVVSTQYTRTKDGFDGVFVVNTDKGHKVVTVNTIRAGGYNIQCLHLRVLTKVK